MQSILYIYLVSLLAQTEEIRISDICSNQFHILDISAKLFFRELFIRPGFWHSSWILIRTTKPLCSMQLLWMWRRRPRNIAFFLFSLYTGKNQLFLVSLKWHKQEKNTEISCTWMKKVSLILPNENQNVIMICVMWQ